MIHTFSHLAVLEDCQRLLSHLGTIEPLFLEVCKNQASSARLGAIAGVEATWIIQELSRLREQWGAAEPVSDTNPHYVGILDKRERLAFCLGGLIDIISASLLHSYNTEPSSLDSSAIREAYQYQNAYIFRQLYFNQDEAQFNQFLLSDYNGTSEQAMEELVQALFFRALAASHTLVPDMAALHQWFNNLHTGINQLLVEIHQQVHILYNLKPAKLDQYRITTTFYDANDPAIQAARAIQHDQAIDIDRLHAAVERGANKSNYGVVLERSIGYLHNATTFWRGGCDTFEMPDVLQDTSVSYFPVQAATKPS